MPSEEFPQKKWQPAVLSHMDHSFNFGLSLLAHHVFRHIFNSTLHGRKGAVAVQSSLKLFSPLFFFFNQQNGFPHD